MAGWIGEACKSGVMVVCEKPESITKRHSGAASGSAFGSPKSGGMSL
jgi:hypothetical protein